MVRLIRPAIVALLLCAARPVLAGNVTVTATAQSEIATLKAQVAALKDQRDLEKRLITVEAQLGQASRADDRQANLIALLGIIITVFLFVLTLRAPREAREAARTVAANELTSARAEFTKLADEERKSVEESKDRLAEVNERADEIRQLAASIKAMRDDAGRHLSTIEAGAKAAEDAGRNATTDGQRRSEATEEQKQKIIAAVAESAGQTEEQWTVDQYKAAIGKALYADEDWQRGAELAQRLLDRYGTNRDALRFGLESLGWAEIGRRHWKQALDAYAALTAEYEVAGETETTDYCFVKHEQGHMLSRLGQFGQAEALYRALLPIRERVDGPGASNTLVTRHELAHVILTQGRAAEAETMLRDLLPIIEKVDGPEASNTLNLRNNIACAILDQGRALEAEAMLRDLLPICERIAGPEAANTLNTRHNLASAILDQGRAVEAEAMLRELLPFCERIDGASVSGTFMTRYVWADALVHSGNVEGARTALAAIPDPVTATDWRPRYEAGLAFVRGRVADAIGDTQAANAHLARAAEIYASIFPEDHNDRQKLKAYLDNRPATKDAPDA